MQKPAAIAHVLGTAQDGGAPQMGMRAYAGPDRTASSLAVVAGEGAAFLIDASPDLRLQQRRLLDVPEYAGRSAAAAFDGVALTHAHMGHYAGLLHFGKEAAAADGVPCWVTERFAAHLERNEPWRSLVTGGNLALRVIRPGHPFEPWPGLAVTPIPVPHRGEFTDTVAYSVAAGRTRLLYVPDIDAWDDWEAAVDVVADHDIALLDATFFSAEELPGRAVADVPHPLVPDTLARFGHLAAQRRLVLTHLNHSNPAGIPGTPEAAAVHAAGFTVAAEMAAFGLD